MRLRLVPEHTEIDFFYYARYTFGGSIVAIILSAIVWATMGLNFGIDFRGGTTIRVQATTPINVGDYRKALSDLGMGDALITEVYDPSFGPNQYVASVRIGAQNGQEAVTTEQIQQIEAALAKISPGITFPSVESVGPKVSAELIRSAVIAVLLATAAISVYIWLRFEWQFALGAVASLVHDIFLTIGIFALFQLRFDLSTIAALLTILGYSINDTVVIFDRLREDLRKYKTTPLKDVMNISVNETLSRTVMTSGTTLVALLTLVVLGGDVIRDFVFAMTWGVVVGTYSSVYVAKNVVLMLGLNRDKKKDSGAGTNFADVG